MRYLSVLVGVALVAGVSSGRSNAQATAQRAPAQRASDAQRAADTPAYEPFSKHHDTRFGHDHFYPDRGTIVRDVAKEATVVNYAGLAFRFHDGIWYEPRGPAFMVVAPPIGLIIPSLPPFATLLARNGQTYVYCNDTYYRPRPDVNGYEVANDPTEATFKVATEPGAASGTGTAAGAVGATSGVAAAELAGASPSTHIAAAPALEESAKVSAPLPLAAAPATPAAPDATLALGAHPAPTLAPLPAAIPAQPAAAQDPSGQTKGSQVVLYPRNGQSTDQQAKDRYECYRFAVAQTGIDPMRPGGAEKSSDYERAQSACFDGRGYAVR
jgi:hypothetical protein